MTHRPRAVARARRQGVGLLLTVATASLFASQAAASPPPPEPGKASALSTLAHRYRSAGMRANTGRSSETDALLRAIAHANRGSTRSTSPNTMSPNTTSDAPTTQPTITNPAGTVSGVVALSATSTAPDVQFIVNGASVGTVAVSGGSATLNWPTWGYANGSASLTAVDCAADNQCGSPSTAVVLDIENTGQPTITSPTEGETVTGGFTVTADAPDGFAGALCFVIDGAVKGFDASAPYSLAYTGTALPEGDHTAQAVECSTDGTKRNGPASAAADFTSNSLHPAITSIASNPFSPNHDGYKDSAKIAFSLPDTEHVSLRILHGATVVRGALNFGALAAGAHSWTWTGTTNGGAKLGTGTYTVQIDTSKVINGATVQGLVKRNVILDVSAPTMASVTGNGAKFFPYPDGYHDTLASGVTLNEAGVLTLAVHTQSGAVVRKISVAKPAGRTAVTWNGRSTANHLMGAGTYWWSYAIVDSVGNRRTSPTYTLVISSKKLIAKSTTITKNGNTYYTAGASDTNCAEYDNGLSSYSAGVWLANVCDPDWEGSQIAETSYHFAIPAAVEYGHLTAFVDGMTGYPPSQIAAAFARTDGEYDIPTLVDTYSGSTTWASLGSVAAAGHFGSARVASVSVILGNGDNGGGNYSDFDLAKVQLKVGYYVLG